MAGTYDPLRDYLMSVRLPSLVLTFKEVENVLGVPLPPSARSRREWWGNEKGPKSHVQCRSWKCAGYEAFPNMASETVTFLRPRMGSAGSVKT
jgi:hypothetical protein